MNKLHRRALWLASLLPVGAALTALTAPPPTTHTALALQSHPQAPTLASTGTPLMITTTSLPNGNQCAFFSASITANNNPTAPDMWTLVSGVLPAGLSMATYGSFESTTVYGYPTTVQTTTFTVQVQDATGEVATRSFSLTIDQPLPLVITSPTPPPAIRGAPYSTSLDASGGCPRYGWSIAAGELPPGLSLGTGYGGTPRIAGTPTRKGTYTFTEAVTDSTGLQASKQFSITVT